MCKISAKNSTPFIILLLIIAFSTQAQSLKKIPCEVRKLSDRVTMFADGSPWENTITAITTEKGILMIDTSNSVKFARNVRELINKELGRNDITYVINTHHHFDHTCGNQIFSDAVIIGHEKCIRGMEQFEKTKALVKTLGFDDKRVRLEWVSAAEGPRWAELMNEFVEHITELGPSPLNKNGKK